MSQLIVLLVAIFFWAVVQKVDFEGPGVRRVGRFIVAIGVIVAVEVALPSTAMTGLRAPAPITPQHHFDDVALTQTPMTYDDVAASTDWLWTLGEVTRDDVAARLTADIARLETELVRLDAGRENLGRRIARNDRRFYEVTMLRDGLQAALRNLDDLFVAGPLQGHAVDIFVAANVTMAADTFSAALREKSFAAGAAVSAYRETLPEDVSKFDDARYQELSIAAASARKPYLDAALAAYAVARGINLEPVPTTLTAATAFPQFTQPLILYEAAPDTFSVARLGTNDGPDDDFSVRRLMRNLGNAITGDQRRAGDHETQVRCGLGFVDEDSGPQLGHFCEVAKPLRLNYDLTGQGCATDGYVSARIDRLTGSGTYVSGDLCKESWVHPYLNVLFTHDSLTVYPPHAVGQWNNPAPLSLWSVEWEGETYPLDAPVTFAWDGRDPVLPGLTVTHGIRPGVTTPRIWRDFAVSRPGADVAAAITGDVPAAHDFSPVTYDGVRVLYASVKDMLTLGRGSEDFDAPRSVLLGQMYERRHTLEWLSRDAMTDSLFADDVQINRDFCPAGFFVIDRFKNQAMYDRLLDRARAMPEPFCEVFYAQKTIMQLAARGTENGSWLWMLPD